MPQGTTFAAVQIIGKLREAEVGLAQGKTVPEVVRKLGLPSRRTTVGNGGTAGCRQTRRSVWRSLAMAFGRRRKHQAVLLVPVAPRSLVRSLRRDPGPLRANRLVPPPEP